MSPKLATPGAHSWGGGPMEVHEVEKCTAGGIPVLIGQLYFIITVTSLSAHGYFQTEVLIQTLGCLIRQDIDRILIKPSFVTLSNLYYLQGQKTDYKVIIDCYKLLSAKLSGLVHRSDCLMQVLMQMTGLDFPPC